MEKREQIKKYFKISSPTLLFILGVLFGLSVLMLRLTEGYDAESFFWTCSFVFGGATVIYFLIDYASKQNIVSDSQMDSWLEDDIAEVIKKRPYDKLGISKADLVAESLLVLGPIYWNVSGFDVKDILMKKGKDGFNRYSIWTIQVFAFTENYLCSYKCNYNWIKNTYINESTNEFFYKDVVSVKTDTVSSAYTLMNGQRLVHSEAFQLKLAGDEITVITNDDSLNTSSVMVSKAEKAVQSIRAMLRDKKK